MTYRIGIDVGGTKISAGLVQGNRIVKKIRVKTAKSKKVVIKQILNLVSLLKEGVKVEKIGIGVPSPILHEKGIVLNAPNMKGFSNIPLKGIIGGKMNIKTLVENDAKCAALAESRFFSCRNLICLTIGTGLGGGIIINGKIYHGKDFAGEIGHMIIKYDGEKCNCGNVGCLEEYVSDRGTRRLSNKHLGRNLNPKEIQDMAEAGNKKAIKVYEEAGFYLGVGLANLVNLFHPELIVLNGSISKARNLMLDSAIAEMNRRVFTHVKVPVKISELFDDAGILGASML